MRFAANSSVFNVEKVKRTNVRVDILESRKVIPLLEVLLFYEKKKRWAKACMFYTSDKNPGVSCERRKWDKV